MGGRNKRRRPSVGRAGAGMCKNLRMGTIVFSSPGSASCFFRMLRFGERVDMGRVRNGLLRDERYGNDPPTYG